jgi:mono/diheme cytochrome c family protein
MRLKGILLGVAAVVLVVVAGSAILAWHRSIPPIDAPDRSAFAPAQVAKGAQVAALGNCNVCHTKDDTQAYAGGVPLPTPFGTIYATNITPDSDTGIGRWSEEAFTRSMRRGLDREGRHLYPAFPYDHFTKMTDDDIKAVYAFLMTREPVRAEPPANELRFPFNFRFLVAGWNLLFLDEGPYRTDPSHDENWNHGAYLAEGAGHCGACHTPRNRFGAEDKRRAYDGGVAEDWHAPALDEKSPAPVPWTADDLFTYLRHGFVERHGVAAGPMAPVARNMADVPEQDVRAIATYIGSLMGQPAPDRQQKAEKLIAAAERESPVGLSPASATADDRTAIIYQGACASCHHGKGPSYSQGIPLSLSKTLTMPDPRNLIHLVFEGIRPPEGEPGHLMPGFAGALTDQQTADLVTYLRTNFTDQPPWNNVQDTVTKVRREHASQ